ncbi:MAG: MerR family transcriptional regulator [Chloroflexi bacterium]|nr:MerR family transcriptional regulator [Chloroflexota bacterium]
MKRYTVRQVTAMAGVSVRTLHHYDQIGLLRPQARTAAGYRLYGQEALLRLQQILFFKELDLPLEEVRQILDAPQFDQVAALEQHRELLHGQIARLNRLVGTIDKTIARLKEEDITLTDAELYAGFTPEQAERYRREARERYGSDMVEKSEQKLRKLSRGQWQAVGDEGEAVTQGLAALADRAPDDPEVQALIARHHAWIENFYPCSDAVYRGLGQLYAEHPEFRAFYDKRRPGLADWLAAAMTHYADHVLAKRA